MLWMHVFYERKILQYFALQRNNGNKLNWPAEKTVLLEDNIVASKLNETENEYILEPVLNALLSFKSPHKRCILTSVY